MANRSPLGRSEISGADTGFRSVGLVHFLAFAAPSVLCAQAQAQAQAPVLRDLDSGTGALLQAVSAPSDRVVWVSGHDGVVLRSTDGGTTWRRRATQTGDSLQFRDVHAFDERRALILSAGPGAQSRIYRTADGGETWSLSWMNEEPDGFYDCMDFWDDRRGLAFGDAVDGGLRVLLTGDGGRTWHRVPVGQLPTPAGAEGGFAASGTCVEAGPEGKAWIGTGAGDRPRVLVTRDFGASWAAVDLPLVAGPAAGAFTLVSLDSDRGFVLGGDLGPTDSASERDDPIRVARTVDGGRTWEPRAAPGFPGAVYGAAIVRVGQIPVLLAAGPGGLGMTVDGAATWVRLEPGAFWAVGSAGAHAWAVGPEGRIVELVWGG